MFLRTACAIIDVAKGKFILEAGNTMIKFNLSNKIKYPSELDDYWTIKEGDEPAEVATKEIFSYPTIRQYIEKFKLKEAGHRELKMNE